MLVLFGEIRAFCVTAWLSRDSLLGFWDGCEWVRRFFGNGLLSLPPSPLTLSFQEGVSSLLFLLGSLQRIVQRTMQHIILRKALRNILRLVLRVSLRIVHVVV